MIDVHTHILPFIDDGARSIDESIAMLAESFLQGVDICIATPHAVIHNESDIESFLINRNRVYKRIMQQLDKSELLYPQVFCGAEVFLDNDIVKYEGVAKLCIENTSYMLVEIPDGQNIKQAVEWIYNLTLIGIKPIIAHIDRCETWEELATELKGLEVTYQINATRFLTIRGRMFIKKFLKYNNDFIVGSDMHNMGVRRSFMARAYKRAQKIRKQRRSMFKDNSKEILNYWNEV